MTEGAQGNGVTPERVDEASINGLLDGVRATKGPNANLAIGITNLNKREASNFSKLTGDMNDLGTTIIETLSKKIDDAVVGINNEVSALINGLNTVDQSIAFLNQKAATVDANKLELENLRREFNEFKANPPVKFVNRIIKQSIVKIVGPAYAHEIKSLYKVLEISKVPNDEEVELNAYDRIKRYVIEPLGLSQALYNETLPTDISQIDTSNGTEKFQVTFKTSKAIGNIFKNINGKNISASINKIVPEDFKWKHDSFKRRSHAMKYILDGEGRQVRKGRVDFKEGVLNLYAREKVGLTDYGPEYIVDLFFLSLRLLHSSLPMST